MRLAEDMVETMYGACKDLGLTAPHRLVVERRLFTFATDIGEEPIKC